MKKLFSSLDLQYNTPTNQFPNVEAYATHFAKQLKPTAAIIVNGKPLIPSQNDSRVEFQKKWLLLPNTTHQLTSFDCHLIPGTGTFVITISGKVKFDETGRNRLGQTADLVSANDANAPRPRPVWGSWFGFNAVLVVDETVRTNDDTELINSMDYRFTFKPSDSVIQL